MSNLNDQRPPFPGDPNGAGQTQVPSGSAQPQPPAGYGAQPSAQPVQPSQPQQPVQPSQPVQPAQPQQPAGSSAEQPTQQVGAQPTQQVPAAEQTSWYAAQAARQQASNTTPTVSYAAQQSQAQQSQPQHRTPHAGQVPPVPPQSGTSQAASPAPEPTPKSTHKGSGNGKMLLFGALGGVLASAVLIGILFFSGVVAPKTVVSNNSQSITIDPSDEDTTLANAVAAKSLPSVVSINVTTSQSAGVGSGVILDKDGNILTNYHVVEDAQTISVSTGGKSYEGTVVGSDESSDLAVVKIDPEGDDLSPIEVGDSSALQVGDWVMSVGSPFGLEQSVSTGIVSSMYRSTMLQGSTGNTIYTNLIQTDAAINPGNSGGALVNAQGELVGINSIIESASGSSSGVGFAIPSNYAVEVAQKIINGETVTHAYLGASFQTVTAQNARRNNLSVTQGAYVAEVTDGSPAAQAGLQKGDIVTAIGDEEITSADGVVLAVRSHNVGDTVKVTYMRGSQQQTVDVTLGDDEALQEEQKKSQDTSQGSLLDQYLNGGGNGYGYGNGDEGYGYGYPYGDGGSIG